MLRVTDASTRPGARKLSYRSPGAGYQMAWNSTSTRFYVISTDGAAIPYAFDPSTVTASRIGGRGDGGLTFNFAAEPEFSPTDPDLIYGITGRNSRTVSQYRFRERDLFHGPQPGHAGERALRGTSEASRSGDSGATTG